MCFISNRRWLSTAAIIALSVVVALGGGLFVALLGGPIALGAMLGLIVLVLILRRIEVGYAALIAVVCLLPFAALPLNFAFKPTFLDVVLIAVFGVWLLERATGKAGGFINTPLTLPVLGFLAIALATFIAGLGNAPPTQTVLRHFAEVILSILLFFLITDTVRDQPRLNLVTKLLIIGGSLAALVAVILYLLPDQTSMELLVAPEGVQLSRRAGRAALHPRRSALAAACHRNLGRSERAGRFVDPDVDAGRAAVVCQASAVAAGLVDHRAGLDGAGACCCRFRADRFWGRVWR